MTDQPTTSRLAATDERFFRYVRPVILGWLALILVLVPRIPDGPDQSRAYGALLVVLGAATILAFFVRPSLSGPTLVPTLIVLGCDIICIAGFEYHFRGLGGAFYPVVTVIPVAWALVLPKQQAFYVAGAATLSFAFGYWYGNPLAAQGLLVALMQILAVPVVGTVVALSRDRQRENERQTLQVVTEKATMNAELQQRLAELQAVSEITELIHSTLEFDTVGADVLEILSRVVGVDACCLFVIDKTHSETLFSATHGMEPVESVEALAEGVTLSRDDSHLTCFPVFSHDRTTVVFCAGDADVSRLSDDDRIVLRAVASELVVAAENSQLYRLTQQLAETDELTGLANYRHLQARLDHELERARRYDKNVSLLMIDADDFKRFNDSQGHLTGDKALRDLAHVIRMQVREVDEVARYGGEEFSIVLPETDAAGAFVAAEKVREAVANHSFLDAEQHARCSLTVSVGVATFPAHAWDKESLLKAADDALYSAKSTGKDRVRTPNTAARRGGARSGDAATGDAAHPMGDTEPAASRSPDHASTGE